MEIILDNFKETVFSPKKLHHERTFPINFYHLNAHFLYFEIDSETPSIGYVTLNNYTTSDCSSTPTVGRYPLGGCSVSTQSSYGASFLTQCTTTSSIIPVNDYALIQR